MNFKPTLLLPSGANAPNLSAELLSYGFTPAVMNSRPFLSTQKSFAGSHKSFSPSFFPAMSLQGIRSVQTVDANIKRKPFNQDLN